MDHDRQFSFARNLIFLFEPKHGRNLGSVYNRHGFSWLLLFLRREKNSEKPIYREEEGEHDTVEGDAHTIISCIIFSMSCAGFGKIQFLVLQTVSRPIRYQNYGS